MGIQQDKREPATLNGDGSCFFFTYFMKLVTGVYTMSIQQLSRKLRDVSRETYISSDLGNGLTLRIKFSGHVAVTRFAGNVAVVTCDVAVMVKLDTSLSTTMSGLPSLPGGYDLVGQWGEFIWQTKDGFLVDDRTCEEVERLCMRKFYDVFESRVDSYLRDALLQNTRWLMEEDSDDSDPPF